MKMTTMTIQTDYYVERITLEWVRNHYTKDGSLVVIHGAEEPYNTNYFGLTHLVESRATISEVAE